MRQLDLFGQSVRDQLNPVSHSISIFHDESGIYGHGDWVLTGLLWINENQIQELSTELKLLRLKEGCEGKIHFKKFQKSFKGDYGYKPRVARDWFNLWVRKWSKKTWFNAVAVNRTHPVYDHRRYAQPFHSYNRFVAIALKSGLSWFFKGYSKLSLSIYSDGKSRRPDDLIPDGITSDNFEEYIFNRLYRDAESYHGPKIHLNNSVQCILSPHKGCYNHYQEILQLTDLLLGSISEAIAPKSSKETKIWFAKNIARMMKDIRLPPWEQEYGLHRKFSISYFPNDSNKFYNNGPIGVLKQDDFIQSKLPT